MNNRNLKQYSSDPDARFGVKGKNDIWLGYKRHVGVDTHQGIITKVAVTPANVHDGKALKHVAPKQGAVLADKIYSDGPAQKEIKRRGLHSMAIKKNNAPKGAILSRLWLLFGVVLRVFCCCGQLALPWFFSTAGQDGRAPTRHNCLA